MKRWFALLLLVGFLSALVVSSAHVHKAADDASGRMACIYCSLATSPGTRPSAPSIVPPPPAALPCGASPLVPLLVQICPLDFSPNHSPPPSIA